MKFIHHLLAAGLLAIQLSPAHANGIVMINELMYHPADASEELEFIELHNTLSYSMDLSEWILSGNISFTFPAETIIPADGFLVVAKNPAALQSITGRPGFLGPFTGQLSNTGDKIALKNKAGRLMDEVSYRIDAPWPTGPAGSGASLAKKATFTATANPANWHPGPIGGTPGWHNFAAETEAGTIDTTLISKSANWKYHDHGIDLGTAWKLPAYDDSTWSQGPSPLGFDDPWITTTVSFGPNPAEKHPTTYFRHTFTLQDLPNLSSVQFSAMMDDGAILYLNGVEFERIRLDAGTIDHGDFANDAVSQDEENQYEALDLPLHLLQEGGNLLAVELHQQSSGSSDLAFSAELVTSATVPATGSNSFLLDPPELLFNEISGSADSLWIELINPGSQAFDPDGYLISAAGDPAREYVLPASSILAGGFLLINTAQLPFTIATGEAIFLYRPDRASLSDAQVRQTSTRARLDDAWLIPSAPTPGNPNTFSLNEDIVINEIMYHHQGDYQATTYDPSNEEWIELFNRGTTPVDLSGWTLDGGISYTIPPGTILAADGFLVIDSFSGSLSNRNEAIHLRDALGNPVDEVHYFDGGRWPDHADGGGSSLELRDPWADNSKAEAWAASDEASKSTWQTYTFETLASASSVGPDGQWKEFIFGLLDAGEILLDDLSVIEDPAGTNTELISTKDFESSIGDWRIIGNHRHSEVIIDPTDGGNRVLHLRASGATEHMHNHAEITLADNQSVENNKTYRISFRAKWLTGSRLLNTRLYFNRAPHTHILQAPNDNGTPGAPNSTLLANIGPTMDLLRHSPVIPEANQAVTVSLKANDPQGITSLTLHYSVNGASWQQSTMIADPPGQYTATIPGQSSSSIVHFYTEATDTSGATSFYPAAGPDSRALYMVNDGESDPNLHNFRIIMTAADSSYMHAGINAMSNEHLPCTIISRDQDVYYNAGVHLKGSLGGRESDSKSGYRIKFNKDDLFNGVLDTVAVDKSSLNDLSRFPETFSFLAMNRAGSVATKYNDWIKVIAPRTQRTNAAQLQLAHYSNATLDSQFKNGSDGLLYEYEYVYYQVTADANGNKTSSGRGHTEKSMSAYSGTDKEDYRHTFLLKNNRSGDEFTDLINFVDVMGSSGSSFNTRIADVADVNQWLRGFAYAVSNGCGDNFSIGRDHNAYFYQRASDGHFLYIPHDMDQFHVTPNLVSANIYLQKMIAGDPNWERLYYAHMRDILDTAWNPSYMQLWTDEFTTLNPSAASNFNGFQSHITSAYTALNSDLKNNVSPPSPFALTSPDQTVNNLQATITGNGWLDVAEIRLDGYKDPLDFIWSSQGSGSSRTYQWSVVVPLEPGLNTLNFSAYDFGGNLIDTLTTNVTSTATGNPLRDQLRMTELMVNPVGGSTYEFVEFMNIGDTPLDLTGVHFSDGITFEFTSFTTLAAGQRCIIYSDLASFLPRYGGAGITFAGKFDGKLSNAGETLTLSGPLGEEILSIDFQSGRGWPLAADGAGHSLVPLDFTLPGSSLNHGGNWRASATINGSPSQPDPTFLPLVQINELTANTSYQSPANPEHDSNDTIELYNPFDTPRTLGSDWYLSDDSAQLNKWPVPATANLPAKGFLSLDEVNDFHSPITSGFGLDQQGEQLFLSYLPSTGDQYVVDAIRFKAQQPDQALGRYQDGDINLYNLSSSPGLRNLLPSLRPVISEIMYHPAGNTLDEFIEIQNPTQSAIDFWNETGAWRIAGGADFTFPPNTTLPPGGHLVLVTFDPADTVQLTTFLATYSLNLGDITVLGPLSGNLSNSGERLALEQAQPGKLPGDPIAWNIIDEVIYFDQAPWTAEADGTGKSLQRKFTRWAGNDPTSWYPSFQPSPGYNGELYGPQNTPDWWLASQDPNWSLDFEAAALADHDLDGSSTGSEFIAGTDPLRRQSTPHLQTAPEGFLFTTIAASPDLNGLQRHYSVKWSEDLQTWGDFPLPGFTDIPGDGRSHLIPAPIGDFPRGFYSLEISLQE